MNSVLFFLIMAFQLQAEVPRLPEQGRISFSYPNGIYTPEMSKKDFGQTVGTTKLGSKAQGLEGRPCHSTSKLLYPYLQDSLRDGF